MAPEIFSSQMILNDKVDSYSFGVLALELITGSLLYSELTLFEALERKRRIEGVDLKKWNFLSKSMIALIEKCL